MEASPQQAILENHSDQVESMVKNGNINPDIAKYVTDIEERPSSKLTVLKLNESIQNSFAKRLSPEYVFTMRTVAGIFRKAGATGVAMGSSAFGLDTMSGATKPDDGDINFSINDLDEVRKEITLLQGNTIFDFKETVLDHGQTVLLKFWIQHPVSGVRTEVEMFAQGTTNPEPGQAMLQDYPDINFLKLGIDHHTVYSITLPGDELIGTKNEELLFYARASSIELYTKTLVTEFLKLDFDEFENSGNGSKTAARIMKLQLLGIKSMEDIQELAYKFLPPGPETKEERTKKVDTFMSRINEIHASFKEHIKTNKESTTFADNINQRNDEVYTRRENSIEAATATFEKENALDLEIIMQRHKLIKSSAVFLQKYGFLDYSMKDGQMEFTFVIPDNLNEQQLAEISSQVSSLKNVLAIESSAHKKDVQKYNNYEKSITQDDEFPAYILIERTQNNFLSRVDSTIKFYDYINNEVTKNLAKMKESIQAPQEKETDAMNRFLATAQAEKPEESSASNISPENAISPGSTSN